jgi:CMP-N-acetylneuraminic acid synthetase
MVTSFVIFDESMVNIDTELDFKLAEFLLQSKGITGGESN